MTTQRLGELEEVIGQVAASYGAGRLIDSLGTAHLPNKRQVIEALNHLKAVTYLGYYTTGMLDEGKLRFAIASHIYPAYEILVEQIRRAVEYEGFRSTAGARDQTWPVTAAVEVLRKLGASTENVTAWYSGAPYGVAASHQMNLVDLHPVHGVVVSSVPVELPTEGCHPAGG